MRQLKYILTVGACMICLASCLAPQKSIYFSETAPQNPHVQVDNIDRLKELTIQPEDILAINVTTISSITANTGSVDPAAVFNNGGTNYTITASLGGGAGGGGGASKGYLVDENGYIDYPVVGKIKVSGLTLRHAKELITKRLEAYVKEPVVEARIINYKITILGEVGAPGSIVAPNHKISVVEALAAAGDVLITGRKDNVLIIRETEGRREFARLNLNSKTVFQSPYYYLKQNDIVYVEPTKLKRQETNDFLRFYLPTLTTLLSTAITIYGVTQITK